MAGRDFGELVFERLRQGVGCGVPVRSKMLLPFRPTVGQASAPGGAGAKVCATEAWATLQAAEQKGRLCGGRCAELEVSSGRGVAGVPACCRADRCQYAISGAGACRRRAKRACAHQG